MKIKDKIKVFKEMWCDNYVLRTYLFATISSVIGIAFTIYNGILGMIPAITMAVYTTYRITISIINFSKSKKGIIIFL